MTHMLMFSRYIVAQNQDLPNIYMEKLKAKNPSRKMVALQANLEGNENNDSGKIESPFKGWLPPSSRMNEANAWKYIDSICDDALRKYRTTLTEDVKLLEKDIREKKLSMNETNCIMYRKNEKLLLLF